MACLRVPPIYCGKIFDSGIVVGAIHCNHGNHNNQQQHTSAKLQGPIQPRNRRNALSNKKAVLNEKIVTLPQSKLSRLKDLTSELANKKWDFSISKENFKNFPEMNFFSKEQLKAAATHYLPKAKHPKPIEVVVDYEVERHTLFDHITKANEGVEENHHQSSGDIMADKPDGSPTFYGQMSEVGALNNSKPLLRSDFLEKSTLDKRTLDLLNNIKDVATGTEEVRKLTRLRQFNEHLIKYPDCRSTAVKNKARQCFLPLTKCSEVMVKGAAHEALALIGYVAPPKGWGIRLLSIDGGGTRGLVAIETLKMLEKESQKPIQQMFDFVIGTSTGSLVAALLFLYRLPLAECEEIYKDRSIKMFTQNWFSGGVSSISSQAYHDTQKFEEILRTEMGDRFMMDFARDPTVPKMCVTSTLVNVMKWKNFMFRNYNLPPGVYAEYPGNCKQKVWEAIRASTAAPMFYKEFQLGDYEFRDGGLLVNNPTALGIHECKMLWPIEPIQCVVSVGTGRYEPNLGTFRKMGKFDKMKDLAKNIAESATDTEGVHTTMRDMLPSGSYFRFNPYLAEECSLSEIRPEKMDQLQKDAQNYLHRNNSMVKKAVRTLNQERTYYQHILDQCKSQYN